MGSEPHTEDLLAGFYKLSFLKCIIFWLCFFLEVIRIYGVTCCIVGFRRYFVLCRYWGDCLGMG